MKLFLIRHAESEHNVQGLLAGVTDSRLTSHGVLQTQRLGEYFASRNLRFSVIYSSDLQRARMTAEAISSAQHDHQQGSPKLSHIIETPLLREQDFGSFECVPWASKLVSSDGYPDATKPEFVPKETKEAMQRRANTFLDDCFTPVLHRDTVEADNIALVSHGLFLATLWKDLIARMPSNSISLAPEISLPGGSRPLEYLPAWSNTGYLELDLHMQPSFNEATRIKVGIPNASSTDRKLEGWTMNIVAINGKEHLNNLKRTRGGLGNVTYDSRQQKLDAFFKRPKKDDRAR